jgi:hypothetical protein
LIVRHEQGISMQKIFVVAALALLATPAIAANQISNGSFETGDFTGWAVAGDTPLAIGVIGSTTIVPATSGTRQAFLSTVVGQVALSQSFASTIGETYRFSFDVYADGDGQLFDASIGGVSKLTLGAAGHGYLSFDFNHVATAATTDVVFTVRHNQGFYLLDKVTVSGGVPEPTSWAMLIAGFGLTGAVARRRGQQLA